MNNDATENKVELMTAQQAADMLTISRSHIVKIAKSGNIPSIRLGNTWRFRRDVIEQVLESGNFQ